MMVPGHAAHAHRVGADSDRRRLGLALGLMLAFLAAELAAAIVAHSLALLSDAAHMLTDAAGIALALLALALALRPPQGALTTRRDASGRQPASARPAGSRSAAP